MGTVAAEILISRQTFNVTPFHAASAAATEEWETYRNEEYGFEFMHPQNTIVVQSGPNDMAKVMMGERVNQLPSGTNPPTFAYVQIMQNRNNLLNIEVRATSTLPMNSWNLYSCATQFVDEEIRTSIIFSDQEAVSYKTKMSGKQSEYLCVSGPTRTSLSFMMEYPRGQVVTKILSTFKFIK